MSPLHIIELCVFFQKSLFVFGRTKLHKNELEMYFFIRKKVIAILRSILSNKSNIILKIFY